MILGTFYIILLNVLFLSCFAYPKRSDLAIVLDVSKSIAKDDLADTNDFIQQHLYSKSISPGTTRVGLITFASKAYLKFSFEKYVNREGLYKRLEKLKRRSLKGKTNIASALKKALYLFRKYRGFAKTKELYIFSDGKWNYGKDPSSYLRALKKMGIKITVFAIGKRPNLWNLKHVSKRFFRLRFAGRTPDAVLKRLNKNSVSYGLCSKPGKHIDECNRHCTCTDGVLTNCYRNRREFTSMTLKERKHYIQSYLKLTTTEPIKSRFKIFVVKHNDYFWRGIHEFNMFYPWHRWYVYHFENLMREVDCRITVPFWDWSYYSKIAWKRGQHIWREDEYGLGGNGSSKDSYCVKTGPFRDGVWKPPGYSIAYNTLIGISEVLTASITYSESKKYKKCLRRTFNKKPANVSHVLNTINLTCSQINKFNERTMDYHNDMHNHIGGTMCSNYAANAPVFFFHHGFLDNIWYRWQQRHPACIRTYYDKHPVHLVGSKYESKYFVDSHDQGESVNVKYEDFLTGRVDPKIFHKVLKITDEKEDFMYSDDSESSEAEYMSPFTRLKLEMHRSNRDEI